MPTEDSDQPVPGYYPAQKIDNGVKGESMMGVRRNSWKSFLFGIFTVLLALLAACATREGTPTASSVNSASPSPTLNSSSSTAPATPATKSRPGPDFPGKQPNDISDEADRLLAYGDGVLVTASTIEGVRRDNAQYICSQVSIENSTTKATRFSYTDWKLQLPSQVINRAVPPKSPNGLGSAELAAGGVIKGDVCFNDDSGRVCLISCLKGGTYVLLLTPTPVSDQRLAWINNITDAPTLTLPPSTGGYSASITGTCDSQGKCYGVKQRTEPKNEAPQIVPDVLEEGAPVKITCQTTGDLKIETDHAPSNLWFRLTNGAYINSIYITPPGGEIPRCG